MTNKQGQVTLTPGFEAGSDYCDYCRFHGKGKCKIYNESTEFVHVKTENYMAYERCQPCLKAEQEYNQMIPREEVENLLMFVAPVVYNESHDKYQNGVKFVVSRIQELLNQTEETK